MAKNIDGKINLRFSCATVSAAKGKQTLLANLPLSLVHLFKNILSLISNNLPLRSKHKTLINNNAALKAKRLGAMQTLENSPNSIHVLNPCYQTSQS